MLIEAAGCSAGSSPPSAHHLVLVDNKTRIKLGFVSRVKIRQKEEFTITMAKNGKGSAEGGDGEVKLT